MPQSLRYVFTFDERRTGTCTYMTMYGCYSVLKESVGDLLFFQFGEIEEVSVGFIVGVALGFAFVFVCVCVCSCVLPTSSV